MTLFWPDQKVALRIVDDVSGADFDPRKHPDYRVVEVTCAQIEDPEQFGGVMDELCAALGGRPVERTPEWTARNRELHASLFGTTGYR